MDITQELQVLREELIREIDEKIEQVIEKLRSEERSTSKQKHMPTKEYESLYPLPCRDRHLQRKTSNRRDLP